MSDRGWSETPADLLVLISNQIRTVKDFLSFRSVCKAWRSSVSAVNILMPPPQFTNTSSNKQDKQGEGKPYFLGFTRVGILNGRLFKCIGSKHNWIVTVDIKAKIFIVNPFSNLRFDLPPQTAWNFKRQVTKVVLSSTPDKPNCVAVATCADRLLWTAIPGNRSWTIIKHNIDDVVFFKREFYAITWSWSWKVSVFDTNCQPVRVIAIPPLPYTLQSFLEDKKFELYLVEHAEELVMVSLRYQPHYYFQVHRFDLANARLDRVERLRRHWLFLGFHTSILMPTSDPSVFLRDSVYFTQIEDGGGVCIKRFDVITQEVECLPTDHVSFKSILEFDFFQHQRGNFNFNDNWIQ